jgi:hypothetical protein
MGKIFRLVDQVAEEEYQPGAIDWPEFSTQPPTVYTRRREKAKDPEWEEKQEKRRLQKIAYMAKYREQHPYKKAVKNVDS